MILFHHSLYQIFVQQCETGRQNKPLMFHTENTPNKNAPVNQVMAVILFMSE